MTRHLACIVEGHGEAKAVPILIRRIAAELQVAVSIREPFRMHKSDMRNREKMLGAVRFLGQADPKPTGLLVMLDADNDCPVKLASEIQSFIVGVVPGLRIAVVVANKEFECWFLAAIHSLRGRRNIRLDAEPPANAEIHGAAKERLSSLMETKNAYSPTVDQAALTQIMSLDEAASARSFRKCRKEIERLVAQ